MWRGGKEKEKTFACDQRNGILTLEANTPWQR